VKLIDLNLLVYAANKDSPQHVKAKAWVEATLSGEETIALPWIVILGFLRVTTSPRVLSHPLAVAEAIAVVDSWLARPNVVTQPPGAEHWRGLRAQLRETGTAGNLTTDAHLAAIAIEHGAELCSTDADFGRFTNLRSSNPIAV
jgi:toxin-antitoxin system PIN domain toxin